MSDNFKSFSWEFFHSTDFDMESKSFKNQLDCSIKEHDIQDYIKKNSKWFIPLSILKDYDFGHHDAYVVPEFAMGSEYKADYLLIGKNSLGWNYIFVEFEGVNCRFKQNNKRDVTKEVRNGITQIREWRKWIDCCKDYFEKTIGKEIDDYNIPTWVFHYCLVVGRRKEMDDEANSLRGQIQSESGIQIITYDRLVDNIRLLSNGI